MPDEPLTLQTFQPHLGSVFSIHFLEGRFDLALDEVNTLSSRAPGTNRDPFSLLFHGPLSPVLPQQIYPLQHPDLGRLEVFIVPVGPDAKGMRYEAVFN